MAIFGCDGFIMCTSGVVLVCCSHGFVGCCCCQDAIAIAIAIAICVWRPVCCRAGERGRVRVGLSGDGTRNGNVGGDGVAYACCEVLLC
jgi:hypothetical protein